MYKLTDSKTIIRISDSASIAGAGCAVVANGILLIQFTGCRL